MALTRNLSGAQRCGPEVLAMSLRMEVKVRIQVDVAKCLAALAALLLALT